jgi:hypothetical protein
MDYVLGAFLRVNLTTANKDDLRDWPGHFMPRNIRNVVEIDPDFSAVRWTRVAGIAAILATIAALIAEWPVIRDWGVALIARILGE